MAQRKKVQSFSSATCAAKKILLGLQTCAPSASGGRRVRCSQAADPLCQKGFLFDRRNTPRAQHRGCPLWCFSNRQRSAYRSGYFCDSSASSASQSRGGLSSVHVSGEVLSARSYSWPLVASLHGCVVPGRLVAVVRPDDHVRQQMILIRGTEEDVVDDLHDLGYG